jgi:hypothetical protein
MSVPVRIVLMLIPIASLACRRDTALTLPGPDLQIFGESTRLRLDDRRPVTSPWFDGDRVTLVAVRGETIGIQIVQQLSAAVTLEIAGPGLAIRGFAVESFPVARPSTKLYGGSRGAGTYADGLVAAPVQAPAAAGSGSSTSPSNPAYFEIAVAADAPPGARRGRLLVGGQAYPVELAIAPVTLRLPASPRAWAYVDPRELAWATAEGAQLDVSSGDRSKPSPAERACAALFRAHGVLLAPDIPLAWWPQRREHFAGVSHVPVWIPTEPEAAGEAVRGWIAATQGTGQIPFTIPIDEPRNPAAFSKVRALSTAVRAAGGGPGRFLFAVTADPTPELGDAIDLHIGLRPPRLAGDTIPRWTYNGAPPLAGSMVLDAETPGTRTWGWIGWRWNIPIWYVWDALYWHDRHNRKGAPLPGRALDPRTDPVSFDDGGDRGNLDGVLALPGGDGCRPTLRLAALRRGLQDRALLELAASCAPEVTAKLAAELVPTALGDAPRSGSPSWPTDEAAWELARRKLIALASCAR